jgi:putative ABC transport system permease protein
MAYAFSTLWHERQRYLPGVLAVGFSALLIALQVGLLLGLFSITSIPIDHNTAHVWMGAPGVLSVDLGRPIREDYLARMAAQPEIKRCEPYLQGFAYWAKKTGGTELCMVIGSRLSNDSLGAVDKLTPEHRALLAEQGAIVIDESDMDRLGVKQIGDTAEVSNVRVKVVGLTRGLRSLAGPYVFCSIETSRPLLRLLPGQITYVLGECHDPSQAAAVAGRLEREFGNDDFRPANLVELVGDALHPRERSGDSMEVCSDLKDRDQREACLLSRYGKVSAFTAQQFSFRSQYHWVTKTKGGIAMGYAAMLGLLVGAVVTSQTLYAATAASLREFAVLRALGIPRWRMMVLVMTQALYIGVIGIGLALPAVFGLAQLVNQAVHIKLEAPVLGGTVAVTLVMALVSGLFALRSLRQVEPATLLR